MDSLINWMMQITFQMLGLIVQIFIGIIQALVPIVAKLLGECFKGVGWLLHQGFKKTMALTSRVDILILGPGEFLKPGITYRELFDYSQLATKKEASHFAMGNGQNGDVWLGRYVNLKNSKAKIYHDLWLPNEYLYQHCLIVGLPGAGKTEFLLKSLSNLMNKGNLILVDARGDLANILSPLAQQAGSKLYGWDLNNSQRRMVWNFLEELEKFGQEKDIRAVAEAIFGDINIRDPNAVFWQQHLQWLTAILALVVAARKYQLAQLEPSDLSDLVSDRDAVEAILNHLPQVNAQWGGDLMSYLRCPDDIFGREIGFLQQKLSPFKDPNVKQICDGNSTLFLLQSLNSLKGNQRYTLIIGQSLASGKFGSTLAGIIIRYLTNVMYRRMINTKADWTPTYIICDEAPRLKNIDFKEFTAIGRNAKAGLILMCQYIDDFGDQKNAINNCRTQCFLQGISDDTAQWFSKQLGEYERQIVQMVVNNGVVGASPFNQRNMASQRVPVLGIKELTARPSQLPSKRSAIIRINSADSIMTKPFLTDYFNP